MITGLIKLCDRSRSVLHQPFLHHAWCVWQAIAAWNRALEAEPGNAEVLLSMGVSYTNELDQGRALRFLRRWLECRVAQGGVRPAAVGSRV